MNKFIKKKPKQLYLLLILILKNTFIIYLIYLLIININSPFT